MCIFGVCVCVCVFTDNKELILSLSPLKPLRIYFLEMVNGIIQSGSGRTECWGQTGLRRTVILLNSTVRSDQRLRRRQFQNEI